MSRRLLLLLVFALTSMNGGCGANLAPVLQIENAAALGNGGAPLSIDQVQQVVYAALLAKQWNIDNSAPGYFIATTRTGELFATVRIDCGPGAYSIHYLGSSPGLRYTGDRIHRRYNHWVERLDNAIRGELRRAAATGYAIVPQGAPPPQILLAPSVLEPNKPPPPH